MARRAAYRLPRPVTAVGSRRGTDAGMATEAGTRTAADARALRLSDVGIYQARGVTIVRSQTYHATALRSRGR